MTDTKVLQIVHITDMHVGAYGTTATGAQTRARRRGAAALTRQLRDGNWFGWQEGRQTHFGEAPSAFTEYLRLARASEPQWFNETPTWILDTGDLTTLGDPDSIALGKRYLRDWADASGAQGVRTLYGNHDAWPSCMPVTQAAKYQQELLEQKGKLTTFTEWQPETWVASPMRARIGDTSAYIELYAVDSIGWPGFRNARAVGSIDPVALTELKARMAQSCQDSGGGRFRILATHHPIVYPYEQKEIAPLAPLPWPDKMRLACAKEVATWLRNETLREPNDVLAHLLIAGHTHARYPGGAFTKVVTEIHQPWLEPQQLQIVGGSLMLNRSVSQMDFSGSTPEPVKEGNAILKVFHLLFSSFIPARLIFCAFTYDENQRPGIGEPHKLKLERISIIALLGREYRSWPERSQNVTLYFR